MKRPSSLSLYLCPMSLSLSAKIFRPSLAILSLSARKYSMTFDFAVRVWRNWSHSIFGVALAAVMISTWSPDLSGDESGTSFMLTFAAIALLPMWVWIM